MILDIRCGFSGTAFENFEIFCSSISRESRCNELSNLIIPWFSIESSFDLGLMRNLMIWPLARPNWPETSFGSRLGCQMMLEMFEDQPRDQLGC